MLVLASRLRAERAGHLCRLASLCLSRVACMCMPWGTPPIRVCGAPPGRRRCWGSPSGGSPPHPTGPQQETRTAPFHFFPSFALTGTLSCVLVACQDKAWSCSTACSPRSLSTLVLIRASQMGCCVCCLPAKHGAASPLVARTGLFRQPSGHSTYACPAFCCIMGCHAFASHKTWSCCTSSSPHS